jgi:hypothetical protein
MNQTGLAIYGQHEFQEDKAMLLSRFIRADAECTGEAHDARYDTPSERACCKWIHSLHPVSTLRYFLPTFAICFLTGVVFMILPRTASAIVANVTPFEWSMPDRLLENTTFPGYDPASPVPKYDPNALMVPVGGWTVNFNACASSSLTITSYEWFVDGTSVGTVTDCHFSHKFPEEGKYQVSLRLTDDAGGSTTIDETVVVQDFLIVAVGDSYGSGEGNPEIPVSVQAHVDFSGLADLAQNIGADLQSALAQMPGLQQAQQAAQQARDDAQTTVNQAAADLARAQQDLNNVLTIYDDVENKPAVVTARNAVDAAQLTVNQKQAAVTSAQTAVNTAQTAYNNCSGILDCANKLATLTAAQATLTTAQGALALAQTALITAQGALAAARDAAVLLYSAIASIQNFSQLIVQRDLLQAAVNAAHNSYTLAQNAYQNAADAWNQAVAAVASLQSIINDTQTAWQQAKLNAQTQYLNHLPVWTSTPPSWGTPEPTYADIVLNGATPGEALRCHRSMLSGQARAALMLEQADPHTSVTFLHLSCSGATIARGLNGNTGGQDVETVLDPLLDPRINTAYTGIPAQPEIIPQLDAAVKEISGREVDALVISIGGNDVKFSEIITDCVMGEPCHQDLPPSTDFSNELTAQIEANCNPVTFFDQLTGLSFPPTGWFPFSDKCLAAYDVFTSKVSSGDALKTFQAYMYGGTDLENNVVTGLATKMQGLDDDIGRRFPDLDPQRVYITEYPNPTGDDNGNYCGWDPSQPPNGAGLKSLPGVTEPEIAWADMSVAKALHDVTETAAALNSWHFVTLVDAADTSALPDTIGSVSKHHGYCADNHWINRLPESLIHQNDILGAMHPNRNGHGLYAQAIYSYLVSDLYPNGLGAAPRLPAVQSTTVSDPGTTSSGSGSVTSSNSSGSGSVSPLFLIVILPFYYFRRRRLKIEGSH